MESSRKLLDMLADEEMRAYHKRNEQLGIVSWPKWPLRDSQLNVLIRASWSFEHTHKDGLVLPNGRVLTSKYSASIHYLQGMGYIDEDGLKPTKTGWLMLEAFAPTRACFPTGYVRQLRPTGSSDEDEWPPLNKTPPQQTTQTSASHIRRTLSVGACRGAKNSR